MKPMVQTFIVEEAKELIYDGDKISEWKQKCEELGLHEQLALASKDKSPIPFESMNEVQFRVYNTICPTAVEYKKYRKTAIPLEVLGLIKLAEDEAYFSSIQIWYDDKSPDPLVVGMVKTNDYSYDRFLIAKWGDVIRPFEELKKIAIDRYMVTATLTLKGKVNDAKNKLDNVAINAEMFFDGLNNSYDVIGF